MLIVVNDGFYPDEINRTSLQRPLLLDKRIF